MVRGNLHETNNSYAHNVNGDYLSLFGVENIIAPKDWAQG